MTTNCTECGRKRRSEVYSGALKSTEFGEITCSGWRQGSLICKHGHVQSSACNPQRDHDGDWTPHVAPWCCDEENLPPHWRDLREPQ